MKPVRLALAASLLTLVVIRPPAIAESPVLTPVAGIQQVYHPGGFENGQIVESRAIPDCTEELRPPGCFEGDKLAVQATYVGRDAGEPTVGVDKQGNAFFAAAAYDGQLGFPRTFVMRSTNGGQTWQSVGPKLPGTNETAPPATLDPYVYVDPETGRVFNLELYVACSYLSFSDTAGASWTTNPVACGQTVNDHQTIVAANPPAGLPMPVYPNVLYYCFNRVTDASCSRSLDGGLTWHPTGLPSYLGYAPGNGGGFFGVEGFCGGLHGHIAADLDGRLFVPRGYCDQPYLAVSENGGTTWFQTRVNSEPALNAARAHVAEHFAVAADDAGNVYYLWRDEAARRPWLAISKDHGRTFGKPMMIAPPGVWDTNLAVLTAGKAGRIAINFVGTTNPSRSDATRPWNSYMVVSENALAEDPVFLSTTANPANDPIHRGGCHGRCGGMLDFLDIQVSPQDGTFWAAVTDTCTGTCRTQKVVGGDAEGVAVRQLAGPKLR